MSGSACLLVLNARVLTQAPGAPACFEGWLLAGSDGRIAVVEPGTPPSDPSETGRSLNPHAGEASRHFTRTAHRDRGPDRRRRS